MATNKKPETVETVDATPGPDLLAAGSQEGQEAGQAPRRRQARVTETTYVVQVWCAPVTAEQREAAGLPSPTGELPSTWMDIATVTVPAKATRKKVLALALAESGVRPEVGGEPLRLRALDAASAHVTEVGIVQPEPELRIG